MSLRTSIEDDGRKSNNWLDQWQSSKLGTGSRVQSFPRALPSSTDVPVLLLNQPNVSVRGFTGFVCERDTRRKADTCEKYLYKCAFKNIRICVDRAFQDSVNLQIKPESFRFVFSFLSYSEALICMRKPNSEGF